MNASSKQPNWLPIAGLVLAMMLWGSSFIAMKIALESFDPLLVIFARMLLASVVFLCFRKKFGKIRYERGDWKPIAFMAVCEPCLYFSFEVYALKYTSASQAGMVTALLPLMTAFAAWQILNESLTPRKVTGFVVALAGVLCLSLSGQSTKSSPDPLLGNTLELLAMVCATGYTISSRHLSSRYSPMFITALQSFVGCVFFTPALFLPSTRFPTELPWAGTFAIVYLGALISVFAYFLYNYALSRIPAGQASSYVNLIPVFSVILGWLILDERLTPLQYVAAALVLGGTYASQCGSLNPRHAGVKLQRMFATGPTK